MVGKIARNGNINSRARVVGPGGSPSHRNTSCLSPSFPGGASTSHFASLHRRCVTLAARKLSPTPKKKFFVASSTRRTSGIGPVLLALGGQTSVAFYNAPSPPFKHTRLSNVPGFSTSVIPDGGGTLSWRENSSVCARRWQSSRLRTPVHSRRRTGQKTLGQGVWWKLSWLKPCGDQRGGLWRLGYAGYSLENYDHLPIPPHKLVGTTIGSQSSHLQHVSHRIDFFPFIHR